MTTTPQAAPRSGDDRAEQVQEIFSDIAPRYDLLNHLLSMNIDKRWRRRAVDELGLERVPGGRVLDACCGTMDLAVEVAGRPGFRGSVVGSDFAHPMLVAGKDKVPGRSILPVCGDTLRLPFPDASFDGLVVGFGVRNLADLDLGFREFHRVLRPGARAVVLEFTTPPNALVRAGYMLYFKKILPVVGRMISGHPWAYTYLPASVEQFPGPDELADLLRGAGFARARWRLLSFGIAALHVAEKGS